VFVIFVCVHRFLLFLFANSTSKIINAVIEKQYIRSKPDMTQSVKSPKFLSKNS
jgi:hypothetical protein